MLKVAVGHSDDPDSPCAIAEILEQCHDTLEGHTPQVGLLFAAIDFEHQLLLEEIQAAFPDIRLIGSTTDGEMSSILGFQQDSVALMLFCSDTVEMAIGLGYNASQDPEKAAQEAIATAQAQLTQPPKCCLALPEGIKANSSRVVSALQHALNNPKVPILGGTAATSRRFEQTYQFYQMTVLQDTIPVLLLGGNLICTHGVASGWEPLGRKTQITQGSGMVIEKIGEQTALSYYRQALNGPTLSAEFPLAVFDTEDSVDFYLRTPGFHNEEAGSVTFLGEIPPHAWVQVAQNSRENILRAANSSIEQALAKYPQNTEISAALFFSCAARRWLLGTQTQQEYQFIQQNLVESVPICGLYCYGEISPLPHDVKPFLHNQTFVTCLLGVQA